MIGVGYQYFAECYRYQYSAQNCNTYFPQTLNYKKKINMKALVFFFLLWTAKKCFHDSKVMLIHSFTRVFIPIEIDWSNEPWPVCDRDPRNQARLNQDWLEIWRSVCWTWDPSSPQRWWAEQGRATLYSSVRVPEQGRITILGLFSLWYSENVLKTWVFSTNLWFVIDAIGTIKMVLSLNMYVGSVGWFCYADTARICELFFLRYYKD